MDVRGDPLPDESGCQLAQAVNCAPLGQHFGNADHLFHPEAMVPDPARHSQVDLHCLSQGGGYVLASLVARVQVDAVPLYYCITVLLYYCIIVLLY